MCVYCAKSIICAHCNRYLRSSTKMNDVVDNDPSQRRIVMTVLRSLDTMNFYSDSGQQFLRNCGSLETTKPIYDMSLLPGRYICSWSSWSPNLLCTSDKANSICGPNERLCSIRWIVDTIAQAETHLQIALWSQFHQKFCVSIIPLMAVKSCNFDWMAKIR